MAEEKRKTKSSKLIRRQQRAGYFFVLPWVIGFLIFFLQPLLESFWYALNNVVMGNKGLETSFVGMDNYKFLLVQDSSFLSNLLEVTKNMLLQVAICTVLSLFVAVILVQKFRGRTVYRAIFFLPIILTSGVIYSMVSSAVGSTALNGIGNAYMPGAASLALLLLNGGVSMPVLTTMLAVVDAIYAMAANCGVPILLFISGLQKIPNNFYEAARIEGATGWDIFWKITIPKVSPIIFLNIVYIIVDSCTSYGTKEGGNVMIAAIQRIGFGKTMQFGTSAAMAWLYFAVIAFFLLLAWLLLGRRANRIEN